MPDTYESTIRVDANGVADDLRMTFVDGPQFPESFLAVSQGGSTGIGANTGPLSQLGSMAIATGVHGQIGFTFTTQSNADDYIISYWATNNPTNVSGLTTKVSGAVVPSVSGTNYSAQGAARINSGRGSFTIGPFSTVASGTSI